jgi:ribonuclease/clavin/mitogillin
VSELPDGIEPAPIAPAKDAALGIVLRNRAGGGVEVLLGKRSRRSRFMPGNLAFPGGKVDPEDEPSRPGVFERCTSREVLEEAGLAIAPALWHAAGERTTPPIFPVRYRTLFFTATLPEGAELPAVPPSLDEFESLEFADPGRVLTDWEAGRSLVPPPLLPILRHLAADRSADPAAIASAVAVINRDEDPVPRIEFVPGTWVLPVRSRTLPPASCTNVWMFGGRRFLVIDPGSDDPAEIARLLAVVARRASGGDAVEAVLLTHHHRDHVAGAGAVAEALGVPVLAHAETLARIPPLPGSVATRSLAGGETLDLDGVVASVLHTPGHAPGHLALHDAARSVLIAGDLVSGLSTILIGFSDGDMDAYLQSLRACVALGPKTVLPSHGPPLPGASLAATITHREEREAKILAALSDGAAHGSDEIAAVAYAGVDVMLPLLSQLQTRAHLARLMRLGQVEQVTEGFRASRAWREARASSASPESR